MIYYFIKRLVFSISILYTINIIINKSDKMIPINKYTIAVVYLFDFFGIIVIIYLKYYY